jgi:hypothetical protein
MLKVGALTEELHGAKAFLIRKWPLNYASPFMNQER